MVMLGALLRRYVEGDAAGFRVRVCLPAGGCSSLRLRQGWAVQ